MKMYRLMLLVAFLLFVTANAEPVNMPEEKIYGIDITGSKLRLLVISTGCTSAKSFELEWRSHSLKVNRIKLDRCRKKAHKKWLEFDKPTDLSAFKLVNKFAL